VEEAEAPKKHLVNFRLCAALKLLLS